MTLVKATEIILPAADAGRGVGAFNTVSLEQTQALITAAETAGLPVIVQISQNCVRYHGSLAPIGSATVRLARRAAVPVAVHLDHAESSELVHEAVELGFTSVMYDGSTLNYQDNVAQTAEMARFCHEHGVPLEAELGEVGGKDGAHAPGVRTDPGEAKEFVAATGVDTLAVAVGTSHAMARQDSVLDEDLIAALAHAVTVPLVLHGSSGVPDAGLAGAVRAGMTKINIATRLNLVFTDALRHRLAQDDVADPRKYLAPARDAMAAETAHLLRLLDEPGASPRTRSS